MMARKARQAPSPGWQPDVTAPGERHRLGGLEPDNLLAVMALLGLLRALETARPDWQPRAFWDVETHPWRPVLTLAVPQTEAAVAEAAAEGVRAVLGPVSELCAIAAQQEQVNTRTRIEEVEIEIEAAQREGKQISKLNEELKKLKEREQGPRLPEKIVRIASSPEELRNFLGSQDREREAWISCLSGWAWGRNGEPEARNSPLKLTSGQQSFAGLFVTLAKACTHDEIAKSLYRPWGYMHRGDSFRLDVAEARRYAYLKGDPTNAALWKIKGQTGTGVAPSEQGANILAAAAFRSFPVIFLRKGVAIPGMKQKTHNLLRVPIWTATGGRGATLSGIEALLRLAGRSDRPPPHPGVGGWQQFRIIEVGDYKSIARAGYIAATPPTP
ncbi:hypothetical protein KY389_06245 [Paracoccus bogoriensis]|uniref:type I-G CRISPR-associated protein, Cas3-extension family n=1 Tax=Paracoccus bogoriensis TaxID=242065 RepID=UPI001CA5260A|nr:hypothetical protein [Paracoccus bogoriensis]MBW7056297.1 hypothetical protein [Paracoccus bogoriensis]